MARRPKPKSQSRPDETAYQRRIRLYKQRHPGATTQRARGKPAKEHVSRKTRELRTFGMTLKQQHAVEAFADKQAARNISREDAKTEQGRERHRQYVREKYRAATRAKGYDHFVRVRQTVSRMGREKRLRAGRVLRQKGGATTIDFARAQAQRDRHLAAMYDAAEDFFDDEDDWDMVYYH